jgi:hypothetical protein
MCKKITLGLCVFIVALSLGLAPLTARAQQAASQEDDAVFHAGSLFLSLLYFPIKLATCVGTQAASAVAYTATYGVPGNYSEGTNGREIGEVARGACLTPWVLGVDAVKRDYQ